MADPYRWFAALYDSVFERMNRGLRGIGFKLLPVQPGQTVLDIGCGTGVHLAAYREAGCVALGIDPSAAMLAQAQRRLGHGLLQGDAGLMPFAAESFDVVVASLVLHEMDPAQRDAVLAEATRVLRPGGHLLLIEHHPGRERSLRGWFGWATVVTAERLAGGRHYRNFLQFMGAGGVPGLAGPNLVLEQQKIVSGGNLGVFVLRSV